MPIQTPLGLNPPASPRTVTSKPAGFVWEDELPSTQPATTVSSLPPGFIWEDQLGPQTNLTDAGQQAQAEIQRRLASGISLNPNERVAITNAYQQQYAGAAPIQTQQRISQQVSQATAAQNNPLENFAGSAAETLAQTGTGLVGTVAPELGNKLNEGLGYTYDPNSKAATAGSAVGNLLTSLPTSFVPGGAAFLAASTAGQFRNDVQARRASGENISWEQELGGAAGYGLAEYLGEKFGLGSISKLSKATLKGAAKDFFFQYAKTAGINASEEYVTQLAQNAIDKFVLGDEKSLFEGANKAAGIGAAVGVLGGAAGQVVNAASGGHAGIHEAAPVAQGAKSFPLLEKAVVKSREGDNKGQPLQFSSLEEKARKILQYGWRGEVADQARAVLSAEKPASTNVETPSPTETAPTVAEAQKPPEAPNPPKQSGVMEISNPAPPEQKGLAGPQQETGTYEDKTDILHTFSPEQVPKFVTNDPGEAMKFADQRAADTKRDVYVYQKGDKHIADFRNPGEPNTLVVHPDGRFDSVDNSEPIAAPATERRASEQTGPSFMLGKKKGTLRSDEEVRAAVDRTIKEGQVEGFKVSVPKNKSQADVSKFLKERGVRPVWFSSESGKAGFYDNRHPGIVFLDSAHPLEALKEMMGHELVHTLGNERPGLFNELRNVLPPDVRKAFETEYRDAFVERFGHEPKRLHEEGVAVPVGKAMLTDTVWNTVAKLDPTLWQKLKNFWHETLAKLGNTNSKLILKTRDTMQALLDNPIGSTETKTAPTDAAPVFSNKLVSEKGKPFHEQKYPVEQEVVVHFPGEIPFTDTVKGLNEGHALARAKENWPGAHIEPQRSAPSFTIKKKEDEKRPLSPRVKSEQGRAAYKAEDVKRKEAGEPKPVSDKATEVKAAEFAERGDPAIHELIGKVQKGEVFTDVETAAVRQIIDEHLPKAFASNNINRIALLGSLISADRIAGTEAGRAFRQRRDPLTPESHLRSTLAEAIAVPPVREEGKLATKPERIDQLKKIKQYMEKNGVMKQMTPENMKDPVWVSQKINELSALNPGGDKFYEYFISSILSGPQTQERNFLGNVVNATVNQVMLRPVEMLVNTIANDPKAAQFGEYKYIFKGMAPRLQAAWINAVQSFRAERPIFQGRIMQEGRDIVKGPAIQGTKGKIIRAPLRLLTAVDQFMKTVVGMGEVGARAFRQGKENGLKPGSPEMERFIREETGNIDSKSWKEAYQYAQFIAFQEEADPITKKLVQLREAEVYGMKPFRYAVLGPFIKIAGKMESMMWNMTPLGTARMGVKALTGQYKGERPLVVRQLAQQAAAWAAFATLWSATGDDDKEEPWITGSATTQGRDLAFRTAPPYSIKLPGYGWVSYKQLQPISGAVSTMIDAISSIKSAGRGQDPGEALGDFMQKTKNRLKDQTFLSSLGDFIDAMESPDKATKLLVNFGASWVPNLIKQPMLAADEKIRESKTLADTSALDKLKRRALPGVYQALPRVTPWGDEITKPGTALERMLSPFTTYSEQTGHPADALLAKYNFLNPSDPYYVDVPATSVTVNKELKRMTEQEYYLHLRLSGLLAAQTVNRMSAVKNGVATPATVDAIKKLREEAVSKSATFIKTAKMYQDKGDTAKYNQILDRMKKAIERLDHE